MTPDEIKMLNAYIRREEFPHVSLQNGTIMVTADNPEPAPIEYERITIPLKNWYIRAEVLNPIADSFGLPFDF